MHYHSSALEEIGPNSPLPSNRQNLHNGYYVPSAMAAGTLTGKG